MRPSHLIRRVILGLILATPLALFFAGVRGVNSIQNSWKAFHELCIGFGAAFINYVLVHGGVTSVLIISLSIAAFTAAIVFLIRCRFNSGSLKKRLRTKMPTRIDIISDPVYIVDDDRPFALTVGITRPQTYISRALKDRLSPEEFISVLIHEKHHRTHRDTLYALLIDAAAHLLFFIPAIRSFARYVHLSHEIEADRSASLYTSRTVVASALLKSSEDALVPEGALGFSTLAERIQYLIHPTRKISRRSSWQTLGVSAFMLGLFTLSLLTLDPKDVHAHSELGAGPMTPLLEQHCTALNPSPLYTSAVLHSPLNISSPTGR